MGQCGFCAGPGTAEELLPLSGGAGRDEGVFPVSLRLFCSSGNDRLDRDTLKRTLAWFALPAASGRGLLSLILFRIFIDKKFSEQPGEGRCPRTENVVVLASLITDLQLSLGRFAARV